MELSAELSPQKSSVTLVSPSRLATWLRCPKQYKYEYIDELKPIGEARGFFNKGNYFHELSHVYYQLIQAGATPGSDYTIASITKRIQNDIARIGDSSLIPLFGIISKTMIRYIKEQSPVIDKRIRVEGVEFEVVHPFADGLAIFGYADLVYWDSSGNLRVRDHKTGEKAKSRNDAVYSLQLLVYATCLWKQFGVVPIGEISYINTKEYVKQAPAFDKAFGLFHVIYSEKELAIFFDEICRVIDLMLHSDPLPHYGEHCNWCKFNTPCLQERKGIDPTPIIQAHFKRVTRESQRKHASFTADYTAGDSEDPIIFGGV